MGRAVEADVNLPFEPLAQQAVGDSGAAVLFNLYGAVYMLGV